MIDVNIGYRQLWMQQKAIHYCIQKLERQKPV